MCELLIGLPDVNVLGIDDEPGSRLGVHIETRAGRPACPGCDGGVWFKGHDRLELVDLAAFGRPTRLVWRKRR